MFEDKIELTVWCLRNWFGTPTVSLTLLELFRVKLSHFTFNVSATFQSIVKVISCLPQFFNIALCQECYFVSQ